jgi:hypothetical protein
MAPIKSRKVASSLRKKVSWKKPGEKATLSIIFTIWVRSILLRLI